MSKVHDILAAGMIRDFLRGEIDALDDNEGAGGSMCNIMGIMALHPNDRDKFIISVRKQLKKFEKAAEILSERRRDWNNDISAEAARNR